MSKERRLGRGLEALLGRAAARANRPDANLGQPEPEPGGDHRPSAEAPSAGPVGAQPASTIDVYSYPQANYSPNPLNQSNSAPDEGLSVGSAENPTEPMPSGDVHGAAQAGDPPAVGPVRVDIGQIDSNPFQPRQDFDRAELDSLGESLRDHGLLQPVVVRKVDDRFQLIAGERRLRAAKEVGWTEVPVQVTTADDRQVAELAIVENLQRKDLNPMEKAASFQRYLQQYGCTQEELASRLQLDRSTIANLIRLLELPEPIRAAVRGAKITQGHARALLTLGDEREQVDFCRRIENEHLSVRQTEAAVQEAIHKADANAEPLGVVGRDGTTSHPLPPRNEHLAALEQEFRAVLGTKVKITHNTRGRGKLVIHFANHEEFERLRRHFCDPDPVDLRIEAG